MSTPTFDFSCRGPRSPELLFHSKVHRLSLPSKYHCLISGHSSSYALLLWWESGWCQGEIHSQEFRNVCWGHLSLQWNSCSLSEMSLQGEETFIRKVLSSSPPAISSPPRCRCHIIHFAWITPRLLRPSGIRLNQKMHHELIFSHSEYLTKFHHFLGK